MKIVKYKIISVMLPAILSLSPMNVAFVEEAIYGERLITIETVCINLYFGIHCSPTSWK